MLSAFLLASLPSESGEAAFFLLRLDFLFLSAVGAAKNRVGGGEGGKGKFIRGMVRGNDKRRGKARMKIISSPFFLTSRETSHYLHETAKKRDISVFVTTYFMCAYKLVRM